MTKFKVKDADDNDKFFEVTGEGTELDPHLSIPGGLFLEIQKGNVAKHSFFLIRGSNLDVDNGSVEDVWSVGGVMVYLTVAQTMSIVSTSAQDDGAPLGNGARTILITGVDGTGAEISETVILNGTTPVLTVNSYLRVNQTIVTTVGSLTFNDGDITTTSSGTIDIQSRIDANKGIDYGSHFTVPLGQTAFLLQTELNSSKIGGGGASPVVEFRANARRFGAAFIEVFTKKLNTEVTDTIDNLAPFPSVIPARSDIKFSADTDTNNTEVRTRVSILLVKD